MMIFAVPDHLFYLATGMALFFLGLHGLLALQNSLRRVIAVNLMSSGVFLILVALATRSTPVDPVLQALAVTGLVVAVSATSFALSLTSARERHHRQKSGTVGDDHAVDEDSA